MPGSIPLSERVRRADAACEELYAELRNQDPAADASFAEFCGGLADQVKDRIYKSAWAMALSSPVLLDGRCAPKYHGWSEVFATGA